MLLCEEDLLDKRTDADPVVFQTATSITLYLFLILSCKSDERNEGQERRRNSVLRGDSVFAFLVGFSVVVLFELLESGGGRLPLFFCKAREVKA